MKRIFHLLIFLTVVVFYWNTDISNRTEADDAFEYSSQVEALDHPWLYHPHHLAYGVLAKKAYRFCVNLGYPCRAHSFLVMLSSLSAAGAVFLFYRFCYRRYSMRPVSSLFAAGFLAVSYGFWRYAIEAEVIMPAAFLVLLAAYLATSSQIKLLMVVYAAAVAAASVLFHITNAVPVFVAIPLFYLLNRNIKFAAYHVLIAGALVASAYVWVYTFRPSLALSKALHSLSGGADLTAFPKGMVGLGQCLVSGNFLFGYEWFVEGLVNLFPSRMLAEEIYLGNNMASAQRIIPAFTLTLLVITILASIMRAAISWRRELKVDGAGALKMVGGWHTLSVIGLWFAMYAAMLLILEPGNPEVWVLGLVPFWLLVCGLVIAPIARANELWIVLLSLVCLALHNYAGGVALLKNPEADYNYQKAAWVFENAQTEDCVLTAENPVFIRYLRYYAKASVIDLNAESFEQVQQTVALSDRTLILNDVFDYPRSMALRFPNHAKAVEQYARTYRPASRMIVENEFGGVWELANEAPFTE
jgi:hypothetical protein